MYSSLLALHSWLRWLVLLAAVVAIVRAIGGWSGRRVWTRADDRAGMLLSITLDVQFLLGLVLYFVYSPVTSLAMQDFGAAMRTSSLRYWAVEHVFGMLVGIALVHVGRARIHKATVDLKRHRRAAIFFTLALVAILVSIPWPGMPNGRPLLRW